MARSIPPFFMANLATICAGDPERSVMVLLHGVTDCAASLANAIDYFKTRFFVIACDARGHGQSCHFSADQLCDPITVMVDDLTALLGALRDSSRQIIVCGHSMGGAVASETLLRDARLADALILEDPAWLNDGERAQYQADGKGLSDRIRQMRANPISALQTVAKENPNWSWTEISAWYQGKCQVSLDFVATGRVSPDTPYQDYIGGLRVPTLLLSGGNNPLIDEGKSAEIAAVANPMIEHRVCENSGHCLRRDQPAFFYRHVDDWLARVLIDT